PSHGRMYRRKAKGSKPARPLDLRTVSSMQLVELLTHTNKWFRQTALRVLADRKDRSIVPALTQALSVQTGQTALETLWALNLVTQSFPLSPVAPARPGEQSNARGEPAAGLSADLALQALSHQDPFVRLWTAR